LWGGIREGVSEGWSVGKDCGRWPQTAGISDGGQGQGGGTAGKMPGMANDGGRPPMKYE